MTTTIHDVAANLKSFPHEGVTFWDLNSITSSASLWRCLIDNLVGACEHQTTIDMIVALDARGFLIAGALADRLNVGKVMCRKQGKLPGKIISADYGLEYREADVLELQNEGYIKPGMNVLIVDDVLATGGTAAAAAILVHRLKANVVGVLVAIELPFLNGRAKLGAYPVYSSLSIIDGEPIAEVDYCADVITEYEGDVVMVRRESEPAGLAFPGGRIDPWEPATLAASRELREETGLVARGLTFVDTLCQAGRDPRGHKVSLLYRTDTTGTLRGEAGKTVPVARPATAWRSMGPGQFVFDAYQVLQTHLLSEEAA